MFMAKDESIESSMWDLISRLAWPEWTYFDRIEFYWKLPVMWRVNDTKEATNNIMWASSAQEIPGWNWTAPSPSLTKPTQ